MPWLVRYTRDDPVPSPDGDPVPPSNLLDEYDLLVSAIWDLGAGGVAEQGSALIAGFDHLDTARRAGRLADDHGLLAGIEPVDDSWVRRETTVVTVETAEGPVSFPLVAGPAFGHGGHPTTRISLDLLSRAISRDTRIFGDSVRPNVLDIGTGSGVLAIAAHYLGAGRIVASEVDATALESARFNVEANDVEADLVLGDVEDLSDRFDRAGDGFDVIVANVLLVGHERIAHAAASFLAPQGRLIVGGFLDRQADRVVSAYRASRPNLDIVDRLLCEGWQGLILVDRPGRATVNR